MWTCVPAPEVVSSENDAPRPCEWVGRAPVALDNRVEDLASQLLEGIIEQCAHDSGPTVTERALDRADLVAWPDTPTRPGTTGLRGRRYDVRKVNRGPERGGRRYGGSGT